MNRPCLSKLLVAAFVCFGLWAAPVRADDEDDMNVAFNEALKLDKAGKFAEAVPLYEKALQLCVRVNCENYADTANVLNNLALVYADQGEVFQGRGTRCAQPQDSRGRGREGSSRRGIIGE